MFHNELQLQRAIERDEKLLESATGPKRRPIQERLRDRKERLDTVRRKDKRDIEPLTPEEFQSLTPDEYFRFFGEAMRRFVHEEGMTPPACREAVEQELAAAKGPERPRVKPIALEEVRGEV